jgi:hypothetical protein
MDRQGGHVSDKVEALREALARFEPYLTGESNPRQEYRTGLQILARTARLLADNPALYEMLEGGAVVEERYLWYEGPVLIVKEQPR